MNKTVQPPEAAVLQKPHPLFEGQLVKGVPLTLVYDGETHYVTTDGQPLLDKENPIRHSGKDIIVPYEEVPHDFPDFYDPTLEHTVEVRRKDLQTGRGYDTIESLALTNPLPPGALEARKNLGRKDLVILREDRDFIYARRIRDSDLTVQRLKKPVGDLKNKLFLYENKQAPLEPATCIEHLAALYQESETLLQHASRTLFATPQDLRAIQGARNTLYHIDSTIPLLEAYYRAMQHQIETLRASITLRVFTESGRPTLDKLVRDVYDPKMGTPKTAVDRAYRDHHYKEQENHFPDNIIAMRDGAILFTLYAPHQEITLHDHETRKKQAVEARVVHYINIPAATIKTLTPTNPHYLPMVVADLMIDYAFHNGERAIVFKDAEKTYTSFFKRRGFASALAKSNNEPRERLVTYYVKALTPEARSSDSGSDHPRVSAQASTSYEY